MNKDFNLIISCFKDSYFVRALIDPKSINNMDKKEKSMIESMIIYQNNDIFESSRVTLSDISFKDGKFYLEGSFITREDKNDAIIYPSFEDVFNSDTRLLTIGSYESIASLEEDSITFETSYGGYKKIIGGNLDGESLHDPIITDTKEVVKNYIERVSGTIEEKYIKENGIYYHSSEISKDNEDLIIDEDYNHRLLISKPKTTKVQDTYAYLKNERDRLIKEIKKPIKLRPNIEVKTKSKKKKKGR